MADVANGLACAFTQLADRLPGALADVSNRLPGAFADLPHSLIGPFAELAYCLTSSSTDVLDGSACAFADVLDSLAGLTEGVPGATSYLFDGAPQALDQLWIAVDGGENAIYDRRDALQPDLQQGLRLDALYVDSKPAEMHVYTSIEFDQIEDLCLQGDSGIEIVELEVDRVDLEDRDVKENVRIAS